VSKNKMILDEIIKNKSEELREAKQRIPLAGMKRIALRQPDALSLVDSLKSDRVHVIAEIKRSSPSRGVIRENFDPVEIANIYAANGATAISVLTESKYFSGKLDYLSEIKKAIQARVPILRKDFIIDPYQIYESKAAGADAILLIVAILDPATFNELLQLSHEIGLCCLVETHTESEIFTALNGNACIIGINNRDLSTFTIDINTTIRLRPLIPEGHIVVSESGIKTRKDIEMLHRHGVNAMLIGERLMSAPDIAMELRGLL